MARCPECADTRIVYDGSMDKNVDCSACAALVSAEAAGFARAVKALRDEAQRLGPDAPGSGWFRRAAIPTQRPEPSGIRGNRGGDSGMIDAKLLEFAADLRALHADSNCRNSLHRLTHIADYVESMAKSQPVDPEEAAKFTLEQRIANAGPTLTCFLKDEEGMELDFDVSTLIAAIKESLDIVEDAERKGRALDAAEAREGK